MTNFDEAIEVLGCDLADMKACVGPRPGGCKDHSARIVEFEAAIRVLEAAGEMPQAKERLLPHFDEELAHIQCFYCKGIRALLAALPDEEKP